MSVISLQNVTKIYGFGDASTLAIDNISLEIKKGEFIAIMGPSGSGKSTLMNIVGMLDSPTSGDYHLDGNDVSMHSDRKRAQTRREKIGFVFQSFNLLPKITAIENVALPLTYKGISHVRRLKRAEKMMVNVGLHDKQYFMPHQLSGGQVQRIAVARALVNKPSMVLADEPTGNLDTASSAKIMELLREIHDAGNTILMVTHNPELAEYAERFIMMRDGGIELDTNNFDEAVNIITRSNRRAKAEARKEIREEKKGSRKKSKDRSGVVKKNHSESVASLKKKKAKTNAKAKPKAKPKRKKK